MLDVFRKKKRDELNSLQVGLKDSFKKVREEFEEHRESINQNTNEIQTNYELLCKMDMKIEKLAERIDQVCMVLNQLSNKKDVKVKEKKEYDIPSLTLREQEVFLVLYASDDPLEYKEIARRTALTENLVSTYVLNLITKGVPMIKKFKGSSTLISIDKEFKHQQAKENILKINEFVSSSINI